MSKRKPIVVKLDDTECLYKLVSDPVLTFAYRHGAAVVFGIDERDDKAILEFLIRYKQGEIDVEKKQRNIKLVDTDVIEAGGRFYGIERIQRCSKEKLVYVTANRMATAA